jgi:hypothetical protein
MLKQEFRVRVTLVLGIWCFFGFWGLGFGDSITPPGKTVEFTEAQCGGTDVPQARRPYREMHHSCLSVRMKMLPLAMASDAFIGSLPMELVARHSNFGLARSTKTSAFRFAI